MSTYNLTFYKNLNAFEIYKCIDDANPNDEGLTREGPEWVFNWGDTLQIFWVDSQVGDMAQYLLFKRGVLTGNGRKRPLSEDEPVSIYGEDCLTVFGSGRAIVFIEDKNEVAHWSFDFCWVDAQGHHHSIDPEAKIKHL